MENYTNTLGALQFLLVMDIGISTDSTTLLKDAADYPTRALVPLTIILLFFGLISFFNTLLLMVNGLVVAGLFTVLERKLLAAIQRRVGPNTAGFVGILQFLADGVKLVQKEMLLQRNTQVALFILGPILLLAIALTHYGIIPLSDKPAIDPFPFAMLITLTLSSLTSLGLVASSWASNSKYPFISAMRSVALLISYELLFGFVLLLMGFLTGELNYMYIMGFQSQHGFSFLYYLFPIFLIYIVIALLETNRAPFDLAEAESELGAGYNTEHASLLFAYFFLAEYLNMAFLAFFGYSIFVGTLGTILGVINSILLMFGFILSRGIVPRYRFDSIMELGWKKLLPFIIGFFLFVIGSLLFVGAVIVSAELPFVLQELNRLYFVYKPIYEYSMIRSEQELFDLNILFGFLEYPETSAEGFADNGNEGFSSNDKGTRVVQNTNTKSATVIEEFQRYVSNLVASEFLVDWESGVFLELYSNYQKEVQLTTSKGTVIKEMVDFQTTIDQFLRNFEHKSKNWVMPEITNKPQLAKVRSVYEECSTELASFVTKDYKKPLIVTKCSKPALLVAMVSDYTASVPMSERIVSFFSRILNVATAAETPSLQEQLNDYFLAFFSLQDAFNKPLAEILDIYKLVMYRGSAAIVFDIDFAILKDPVLLDVYQKMVSYKPRIVTQTIIDCPVSSNSSPQSRVYFWQSQTRYSPYVDASIWFNEYGRSRRPGFIIDLSLYHQCMLAAFEAKARDLSLGEALDLVDNAMRKYFIESVQSCSAQGRVFEAAEYRNRLIFLENYKPYRTTGYPSTWDEVCKAAVFPPRLIGDQNIIWFKLDQVLRYMVLKNAGYSLAKTSDYIGPVVT